MKVNSRQKMHTSVHSSRIHNSQNVATTQMSTDRGMDKQNVVDPYNGILLSNEKEQRIDKHTNVDGPQQHYTKWKKPDTKYYIWGFPGGAVVESLPANAGDMGSSPGLGRSHMPRSN